MKSPLRPHYIALLVSALLGMIFSAISTYDFVAHLDRQVHAITCSFIPGMGAADASGTSGCHTVLMSPYSSVFRTAMWGGIPIALPAFAVFAYLLWRVGDVLLRKAEEDLDEARYLLVASLLPLLMTMIFFGISTLLIGAVCRLCVGVYVSSLGFFIASLLAFLRLRRSPSPTSEDEEEADFPPRRVIPWSTYAVYFGEGVVFVLIPVLLYVAFKPAYSSAMAECGSLNRPEDRYNVRLKMHAVEGGVPSIEVLDPLCPACRNFSQRLENSGLNQRLNLETVLFPLDSQCNWMVSTSLHPGACQVSEAILCAEGQAQEVLAWSFANQEALLELGRTDPKLLEDRIKAQFPSVAGCLGTPSVKTRLNRSLRWAVANSLPVLTPQLYVNGHKVCDEDTDLGLEYVLTRMLNEGMVDKPAASSAATPSGENK